MTHTYYQLLYHLVWSTKERRPLITHEVQNRLYEYIGGTFKSLNCTPVLFGGMPDHVHLCVEIPPSKCVADIVKNVKVSSSKWISANFSKIDKFELQEGYGAFSVSPSVKDSVLKYIQNQETHHKKHDFREEFLWFLKNHHVTFDERFLWK